ncbi:uncharacterized protein LOC110521721 isoform X1 [Oncorhynchus mykiss]|nr:uncharacterized protein LOC110521721 isoform X1 [Oncorhynchus mykiss]
MVRFLETDELSSCVQQIQGVKGRYERVSWRHEPKRQSTEDMNKVQGELSEREQQMLRIRRDSVTKAFQLSKMEKMLAETRGKLDKKPEPGTESKGRDTRDDMVQDLEDKVRFTRRDRRNSLHRTQLLESQMKTVKGELVDTLDHLQELRDRLRRSQANAEQRKVDMEKLQAGMR